MIERRKTRQVNVGGVPIGGDAPIAVQTMTKTFTTDVDATVAEIERVQHAGADLVRLAVPNEAAAAAIPRIRERVNLPLVADIHFDYRLALQCVEGGIDKIRFNPGNIGKRERVVALVDACGERGIPIRIGVNGGSIEREFKIDRLKPGPAKQQALADAMCHSAQKHIAILESEGFRDIVISLKATNVMATVLAYRQLGAQNDYPFHLGVTEAGTPSGAGTIKSSIGLGLALAEGIGDTIRVSLTGDPEEEVRVGHGILAALGLRNEKPELIACPSCGRAEIDLVGIASEVERRIQHLNTNVQVAIMGCVVNGPGEAEHADIGLAGGGGVGLIFKHGKQWKKVAESDMVETLVAEIEKMEREGVCVGREPTSPR